MQPTPFPSTPQGHVKIKVMDRIFQKQNVQYQASYPVWQQVLLCNNIKKHINIYINKIKISKLLKYLFLSIYHSYIFSLAVTSESSLDTAGCLQRTYASDSRLSIGIVFVIHITAKLFPIFLMARSGIWEAPHY